MVELPFVTVPYCAQLFLQATTRQSGRIIIGGHMICILSISFPQLFWTLYRHRGCTSRIYSKIFYPSVLLSQSTNYSIEGNQLANVYFPTPRQHNVSVISGRRDIREIIVTQEQICYKSNTGNSISDLTLLRVNYCKVRSKGF